MDTSTFLDNFGAISEAPGGIRRLRELVLDLALRGQLVPQHPDDEPANAGLEAVRHEKGPTLAGSIRGGASTSRVPTEDERDGSLPTGWSWGRIDDTGDYVNGLAFKNSDWRTTGVPIVRIQNLTNPALGFNYAEGSFPEDRMARDGDLLVSWSATLNAFIWDRGDAVVNQHIFKVIPDPRVVRSEFLFHLLRNSIRAMAEGEAAHGLVMKHINRGPFLSFVVKIPPLAEQRRIVARMDDLMGLCDDLAARQEHHRRTCVRFRQSALHALTAAGGGHGVRRAWERISTNWDALTGEPGSVDAMRETILQLAIQGMLVAQDPADEPSSELLRRTTEERDRAVSGRETRLATDSADYHRSEPLASHWSWAPLQDVVRFIDYRGRTPTKTSRGVRLITAKNIRRGYINSEPEEFISEASYATWMTRGIPRNGDVLFTTEAPMGNAALIRGSDKIALAQRTINLAPYADFSGAYLEVLLLSPWFRNELARRATGMTATGIKAAKLRLIRVPIPPAAEQRRIVTAVDQLLAECDSLGRALRRCDDASEALLSLIRPRREHHG